MAESVVTCRSSIASSNADWVLGGARLISSPNTRLAKMGPGRNSGSRPAPASTVAPVMSAGIRSGVNWMREYCKPAASATALAVAVLATPGTSSRRT